MKLLLIGPQGCGKGTVGAILSEELQIPLVGSGALLRQLPKDHAAHKVIQEGKLVDQTFVSGLIRTRLSQPDCENGFILEGWGRDLIDIEHFDCDYDAIIVLNISQQTSYDRITGRRLCTLNNKTYNIITLPEEIPDECKNYLFQRADDTEEALKVRLATYYTKTVEVINHYKKTRNVIEVDAEASPHEVANTILEKLHGKN